MMETLSGIDLRLFAWINRMSDVQPLAWAAWYASSSDLLKGGTFMAAYWWFWFAPENCETRRRRILAALIGAIVTLIIARMIALGFPFRVRPLNVLSIASHLPAVPLDARGFENWSSFPSDNAALFFALATGLWRVSRVAGMVAILCATVFTCLLRVYLGFHYPSDVIAGALLGLICALAAEHLTETRLITKVLDFERRFPSAFYAAAFLVTFEYASLFDDVRRLIRGVVQVLRAFL